MSDYTPKIAYLRDGARVLIRMVRPNDARRLLAMHNHLSTETIFQRYMGLRKFTRQDMQGCCHVDGDFEMRLVAVAEDGAIVGESCCVRIDGPHSDTAEFAILIDDAYQRRGLGRMLFHEVIAYAQTLGIKRLMIMTSGQNWGMIALVRGSGYPFTTHIDGSELIFMMSLSQEAEKRDLIRAS